MKVWLKRSGRRGACGWMLMVSGPVEAETLSDALATAYRNSGLIEQNRAVLRAADEDVAQAMAALRPVINYAASASNYAPTLRRRHDNLSASARLSASMLLV